MRLAGVPSCRACRAADQRWHDGSHRKLRVPGGDQRARSAPFERERERRRRDRGERAWLRQRCRALCVRRRSTDDGQCGESWACTVRGACCSACIGGAGGGEPQRGRFQPGWRAVPICRGGARDAARAEPRAGGGRRGCDGDRGLLCEHGGAEVPSGWDGDRARGMAVDERSGVCAASPADRQHDSGGWHRGQLVRAEWAGLCD